MIVEILLRYYKDYGNIKFIHIVNDNAQIFAVYIGKNHRYEGLLL